MSSEALFLFKSRKNGSSSSCVNDNPSNIPIPFPYKSYVLYNRT